MFEDIKAEINLFPLSDEQKQYIETALNIAYDKGKKEGIFESQAITKSMEKKDQEAIKKLTE